MKHNRATVKAELNAQLIKAQRHRERSLVLVSTEDPTDVFTLLTGLAEIHQAPLYLYRFNGLARWDAQTRGLRPVAVGVGQPDRLLTHLLESTEQGAIYVLEDFFQFLADPQVRALTAAVADPSAGSASGMLVFVDVRSAPQHIPDLLRSRFHVISYPLPSVSELQALLDEECPLPDCRARFAAALCGMSMTRARECFREAALQGLEREETVLAHLHQEKRRILSSELGLSLLSVEGVEQPLGLEGVWDYLEIHRSRVAIPGPDRLKGLLFVGPPGTGKTMVARSIGRRLGLPVINFEIGRLMNSLVGATENNVLRATATIDSLAPVVVFIDEIEKALCGAASSGNSDGGTMSRAYGTLLTWMNDSTAPVLILATANHLHRLEDWATLTRSGRFDQLFYVDFPDQDARRKILEQVTRQALTTVELDEVAAKTDGFSGADLVSTVSEANALAAYRGESLARTHLLSEVAQRSEQAHTRRTEFHELRSWASAHCRPAARRLLTFSA